MAEDFESKFLTKNAIRNLLVYLCKSNLESPDPITDALATMLTNPTTYIISKHGLVMFRGAPAYPFTHMDAVQRQLIYNVVNSIRNEYHTYSYFALNENPLTYSVENERITINIPPQKIDSKLVMLVLLELIAESKQPSTLLFNLLVQRLQSRINISKETISFANQKSKEILTSLHSSTTAHVQAQPH